MKQFKRIANLIIIIAVLIALLPPTSSVRAASFPTTAVVLLNSSGDFYGDFQHYLQPYLDNFGIPYTIIDIANPLTPITADISNYAVIIIGQHRLQQRGVVLSDSAQDFITAAVHAGTGLVNFDNNLTTIPYTILIPTIFNFTYGYPTSGSNITFPNPATHFITERHTAGETITTNPANPMSLAGIDPASATSLALSAGQPFLAVATYGQGHAVQWGSYDWIKDYVKGTLSGLDDLVWRSIVWAARKPFVMQNMPPFVTMRVDDEQGNLDWLHTANNYGFKPWLGLFINDYSDQAAADLSTLVNNGLATASIHSFANDAFFYFDHTHGVAFTDAQMAANFAAGTQWHQAHNIPISKFVIPHYYEIGTNAFAGLHAWGVEYIGVPVAPGLVYEVSPWLNLGPYRLFTSGDAIQSNPFYYADYLTVSGHPEYNNMFFDCLSEIRDVTNYEWFPTNDLGTTIANGTTWLKRSLDSLTLATLFSHGSNIYAVTHADWDAELQAITNNIASYHPIYVTLDYACQYARALYTSNISSATFDTTTQQITTSLSGHTDLPTQFSVFMDDHGGIRQVSVDVPSFSGSTQVTYTLPPALDHILVTPNPANNVIAGTNQQFSALGYDTNNNLIPNLHFNWSLANGGGSITSSGLFTAGSIPGTYINTVTASFGSIQGFATVSVILNTLDHFVIDPIPNPKYAGIPFSITIRAQDANGIPVINYAGPANLSASGVTIQPTTTGIFSSGVWSGNVTISQATVGTTITARDGPASGVSNSFVVNILRTCPCSIWSPADTPEVPAQTEALPIELGLNFQTDLGGYITGLRFYKGPGNTGTHYGHLWTTNGTLLGTATFANETDTGWQEATFPTPIAVVAGTTYIASYHTEAGHWSLTANGLASQVYNSPLTALATANATPGNGVYKYGPNGSFPDETYEGSNYWVDVVYNTTVPPDTTPPTIIAVTPTNGTMNVDMNANVTVLFSEAMDPATITSSNFELRDPSNNLVPAVVTYVNGTYTATLNPTSALAGSTTYTARIKSGSSGVKDQAGNQLAGDYSWTFTTAAHDLIPMQASWNLIDLPLQPFSPLDAETFLLALNAQSGHCTEIDRWVSGGWESHPLGIPINVFDITMGKGYFVRCTQPSTWIQQGIRLSSGATINLSIGYNLVSFPYPETGYTAETILIAINSHGGACSEIHHWINGGWESHFLGLDFNNFSILPIEGYFVRCSAASSFTP